VIKVVEEEVVVVSAKSTSKPVKKFSEEEVLFNCCHQDHFKRDARQNAISQILFILVLDIYNNFRCPRAAVPATIPYILRDPFAFATILFPKLLLLCFEILFHFLQIRARIISVDNC